MLAVNYTNLRDNMKMYMDMVTNDYETIMETTAKFYDLFSQRFPYLFNSEDILSYTQSFLFTCKKTISL